MVFTKTFTKTFPQRLRRKAPYLVLLTFPLALVLYNLPRLYDDYHYPQCGHILLFTAQHPSGKWFTSGTEGCIDNEATPWVGDNTTASEALAKVASTSLRILPEALRDHAPELRTFLRHLKPMGVNVFMLKVLSVDSWNAVREVMELAHEEEYKDLVDGFYKDVKKMLREVGLAWDEYSYNGVAGNRIIRAVKNECYIRNCRI